MDISIEHHSDSDSGDSWTLLCHNPSGTDEALAPDFPQNLSSNQRDAVNVDKDEDTDGISIISDSEPESPMPSETICNKYVDPSQNFEKTHDHLIPPDNTGNYIGKSFNDDDFLGDNNSKHRTYVHRRNKRLSTVLNIIVLGSVITAAGVAIGHMWGAKNDCAVSTTTPSVNKILSNLYKLQEENAYLRSKLKELTISNNARHPKISGTEFIPKKQSKCQKVFEESLNNKIIDKPVKCVDIKDNSVLDMHLVEKEYLHDIEKLRNVYNRNKSWLDHEVSKRLHQEISLRNLKSQKHSRTSDQQIPMKADTLETITEIPITAGTTATANVVDEKSTPKNSEQLIKRKISYADSVKSGFTSTMSQLNDASHGAANKKKGKKRSIKDLGASHADSNSDDELKKDDRYIKPRFKQERKKHDRQKLHKKQKRRNKYEQWEMKGGYLKEFDDFSIDSSREKAYVLNENKDLKEENYLNLVLVDSDEKISKDDNLLETKCEKEINTEKCSRKNKAKDVSWYEKRAVLRNEARKKLEYELFGEMTPKNAGWYFRRMQRREQCRAKGDNSTNRKISKRNLNFKMKH